MLSKRIIPCLDIKDGKVVKGINFQGLREAGDPVELAKRYSSCGADEIVFLDISASLEGRKTMIDVVRRTAREVFLPLTVGGGISSLDDIHNLLNAGGDKVSLNSSAIANPVLIRDASRRYGCQCVVVAVDVKWNSTKNNWEVYQKGGTQSTGLDAVEWCCKAQELGAGELLLTSMDRDGTGEGFDCDLNLAVAKKVTIPVIASGGAGKMEDFYNVFTKGKADAALAASIFHYEKIPMAKLKQYLIERGIPIRRIDEKAVI